MVTWTLAAIFLAILIRYVWVSLHREVVEDFDTDVATAIDSIRDAMPVEVRESDFAALESANREFQRRPRVRYPSPLPTLMKGTSTQ